MIVRVRLAAARTLSIPLALAPTTAFAAADGGGVHSWGDINPLD